MAEGSSSSSKTEKATPKKRRDAAKEGQTFKARDLVVACSSFCGVFFIIWFGSLTKLGAAFIGAINSNFELDLSRYTADVVLLGLKIAGPIIVLMIVATTVPSLLQSGFALATKSIKFNFDAINPVNGFKKMFSLRTVKDFIKAALYLCSFSIAAAMIWWWHRDLLFIQVYASIPALIRIWEKLFIHFVLISLVCALIILILDSLAELYLYLKELRMDKQEVKREQKEMEGDPLFKNYRKQAHMDMLSAQDKHNIENSRMVLGNPTHVAMGIYYKPEFSPIPFISIRASNQKALAVRAYAKKVGVPVIIDPPLARRLYKTHKLYAMVSMDEVHHIVHLLAWLQEVERARQPAELSDDATVAQEPEHQPA